MTALLLPEPGTGLGDVLIVASVLVILAAAAYLPPFVMQVGMALDRWAQRRVDQMVADAVHAGVIPPAPGSLEATRPVDLDDCSPCEGTGLIQTRAVEDGGYIMWVTCSLCRGSGQRGVA